MVLAKFRIVKTSQRKSPGKTGRCLLFRGIKYHEISLSSSLKRLQDRSGCISGVKEAVGLGLAGSLEVLVVEHRDNGAVV